MSREIVEALRGLEQEKGIDAETLMAALEDALLSAYKKSLAQPSTRASISTATPPTSASTS